MSNDTMQRTIIGLLVEDFHDDGDLDSVDGGSYAIDVQETLTYLDGDQIQHGHAAERVTTDREVPQFSGSTVDYVEEPVAETLATEFFADLEAGFVAVDSADGEILFGTDGLLFRAYSLNVTRAVFDVPAFAESLTEQYDPTWWQIGWAEEDSDGEPLDAGVTYHRGTRERNPTKANTSQLGFEFRRDNGERVRGTCARSGYIEVYEPEWTADAMARWLRDDVLPHCSIPADHDEQATLDEDTAAQELCERCEVKTASRTHDGGDYCVTCHDKVTREVAADD